MAVERLATSIYTNARNGNLNSEETKKKVGEAAVGTSAAAAAGRKAGFSMFKSSSKVGALSGEVVDNIRLANKPVQETKFLFGRFGRMMTKYAEAFSGWVQKAPVIGKIVKTSLFAGTAKCLGFGGNFQRRYLCPRRRRAVRVQRKFYARNRHRNAGNRLTRRPGRRILSKDTKKAMTGPMPAARPQERGPTAERSLPQPRQSATPELPAEPGV